MSRPPPAAPVGRESPDDPDLIGSPRATVRVVAAVSAGGVVGALARYQIGLLDPVPPTGFPWPTLVVNVSGCLFLGLLLTVIVDRPGASPLLRPFLGTGVLGGYTTFSAYALDVHRLLSTGRAAVAALYLVCTLVAALTATALGMRLARRRAVR